ncbi:MAG: DUF6268 family outer membrane beta-barrel protein [Myxococcota bacterium]
MIFARPTRWLAISALAALCFAAVPAAAQPSIASISYRETRPADVRPDAITPTSFELGIREFDVQVTAPLRVGEGGTVLLPGLRYGLAVPVPEDAERSFGDNYHELGVGLTALQPLSQKWTLIFGADVVLGTDFQDVDASHVRASFQIAAQHQRNPKLMLGFGITASYALGELLPLPILSLRWEPADYFRLNIAIPRSIDATFIIANRVELGVSALLDGNRYSVDNPTVANVDVLALSSARVGVTAGLRLFGDLWLSATLGRTVFRRFDFEDASETLASLEPESALVLEGSLVWRLGAPPPPREPEARSADSQAAEPDSAEAGPAESESPARSFRQAPSRQEAEHSELDSSEPASTPAHSPDPQSSESEGAEPESAEDSHPDSSHPDPTERPSSQPEVL